MKRALKDIVHIFQIKDEIFIRIKPEESAALRYGEVTGYIQKLKIKNVDFDAVKRAFKKCRGQSVPVARGYTGGSAQKPSYSLEVSRDAMLCHLTLYSPQNGKQAPEAAEIQEAMKVKKIEFEETAIREALEKKVFNERVVVARGVYPEVGKDAVVKPLGTVCRDVKKLRSKFTSVKKFRECTLISPVKESDCIAELEKESSGAAARNVHGDPVSTVAGKPLKSVGANIFMSEKKIFANIDGHVIQTSEGVRVVPLLLLKSVTNRKIVFEGSVKISGDVESCPLIEASGDIEILGTVNNTAITAGGNLLIHGNLFTKHDKPIVAGRDFAGQNVSNAAITAENITITATSFNSHLTAYRTIQNTGDEGKIVGGRSSAGIAVFASSIGSNTSILTKISVATIDFITEHKIKMMEYYANKIKDLNAHLTLLEEKAACAETLKRELTKERGTVYDTVTAQLGVLMEKDELRVNRLLQKVERIKGGSLKNLQGEILVKKIFPNTSLFMGGKERAIKEAGADIRFRIIGGEITSQTFYRDSLRW